MSCLEISAASGVLTGRKAAAMMGAARRPRDVDGGHRASADVQSRPQCRAVP